MAVFLCVFFWCGTGMLTLTAASLEVHGIGFNLLNTHWSFYSVLGPHWHWKYKDEQVSYSEIGDSVCYGLNGVTPTPTRPQGPYVEAIFPNVTVFGDGPLRR